MIHFLHVDGVTFDDINTHGVCLRDDALLGQRSRLQVSHDPTAVRIRIAEGVYGKKDDEQEVEEGTDAHENVLDYFLGLFLFLRNLLFGILGNDVLHMGLLLRFAHLLLLCLVYYFLSNLMTFVK